jgi:hypothetical protein
MPTTRTNAPESEAITLEETEIFEAARRAVADLKTSYERWIVIGRAVVLARDMANRRGGSSKMVKRIIEQQELGFITGPDVSRLLRIMPRIEEVTAWRATLTDRQRYDWASPQSILKRCPIFNRPTPPNNGAEERMRPAERDRQELSAALQENHELRRQLDQRQDGDTSTPRRRLRGRSRLRCLASCSRTEGRRRRSRKNSWR